MAQELEHFGIVEGAGVPDRTVLKLLLRDWCMGFLHACLYHIFRWCRVLR